MGHKEEDPVLGTCQVFKDRPFWAWRRVGFGLLFVALSLGIVVLGLTQNSLISQNIKLAQSWPLMVPLSVACAWGTLLALLDALRPRCAELRVGDEGFATTIGGKRTDIFWSNVRAIERQPFSSFLGRSGVRVTLDHHRAEPPDDQSPPDDGLAIRTDVMANSGVIAVVMLAACGRWHEGGRH